MRTKEINDWAEAENVIKNCSVCYVGMCGSDMKPYVIPMSFGYLNGSIVLHSGQKGRKWETIKQNQKVCVTFSTGDKLVWQNEQVACSYSMKAESVIIEGVAKFIDDFEEKTDLIRLFMQHYSDKEFQFTEPAIRNVGIIKIDIEKWSLKSFGNGAASLKNE